jgi:hypothetical protein
MIRAGTLPVVLRWHLEVFPVPQIDGVRNQLWRPSESGPRAGADG